MRTYIMNKQEISYYLEKVNSQKKGDLVSYVNNEGQLNDIDYYVEVMKKYYPDNRPLKIILGGLNNVQENI